MALRDDLCVKGLIVLISSGFCPSIRYKINHKSTISVSLYFRRTWTGFLSSILDGGEYSEDEGYPRFANKLVTIPEEFITVHSPPMAIAFF